MRDTIHNETYLVAIPPVVVSDDTGQVGNWIDRSGYDSLSFAILTGTLADTDATFTVLMEEANASNYSDAYAVCVRGQLECCRRRGRCNSGVVHVCCRQRHYQNWLPGRQALCADHRHTGCK